MPLTDQDKIAIATIVAQQLQASGIDRDVEIIKADVAAIKVDWERVRDRVDALFGWVSSSDASPYRIVHDPRDGKVHVVAFGTRRHLQSPEAMWVSGYHWGEVQSLPALAAMKGMSEARVYAAFDGLPKADG